MGTEGELWNSGFDPAPRVQQFILQTGQGRTGMRTYINRTPVSKTGPLSPYQLTHDKVMLAWTSDIHAAARQEPTGGPVFILYSTQSSSYIYRYTVLIRYY